MEILLAAVLPLIILACFAYYFFAPRPESEFSKKFSLDNVLRKTLPVFCCSPFDIQTWRRNLKRNVKMNSTHEEQI